LELLLTSPLLPDFDERCTGEEQQMTTSTPDAPAMQNKVKPRTPEQMVVKKMRFVLLAYAHLEAKSSK
jgi:hypothetical protein